MSPTLNIKRAPTPLSPSSGPAASGRGPVAERGSVASRGGQRRRAGAAARRATGAEDDAGPLAPYFREILSVQLMSPARELELATEILACRVELWRALLSAPEPLAVVLDLVDERIAEDKRPRALLRDLRAWLGKAKSRARSATARSAALTAKVEALAPALVESDPDNVVPCAILACLAGRDPNLAERLERLAWSGAARATWEARVRAVGGAWRARKHEFAQRNLRLVVSVARRFINGHMALADLIQEGNIGLLKAIDRFDPRRGFRFSTYASWWIRHAITRAVTDRGRAVRLPVHVVEHSQRIARVSREFEGRVGRAPSRDELAAALGVEPHRLDRFEFVHLEAPISLDRPQTDDADGPSLLDLVAEPEACPLEQHETEQLVQTVRTIVDELRPLEAAILRKRFGIGDDQELTLREIGQQHSLSRERIRQLQELALAKVRSALERRELIGRP